MLDMSTMSRGDMARARDRLAAWDRNHASAQRYAIRAEQDNDWPSVFAYMPETTMCSEYMPGRRKLLEAADENDSRATQEYAAAAFHLLWHGPISMAPLSIFETLARHDDLRREWAAQPKRQSL